MESAMCLMEEVSRQCAFSSGELYDRARKLDLLRRLKRELEKTADELRSDQRSYATAELFAVLAGTTSATCDLIIALYSLATPGPASQIFHIAHRDAKVLITALSGGFDEKAAWRLLEGSLMSLTTLSLNASKMRQTAQVLRSIKALSEFGGSLLQMGGQQDGGAGLRSAAGSVAGQLEALSREITQLEAELVGCTSSGGY